MGIITDLKFAVRSLARVKGLTATVIITLALGIGANAAIFSVVREVLLRPLVNRDQDRLIYIKQSRIQGASWVVVDSTTGVHIWSLEASTGSVLRIVGETVLGVTHLAGGWVDWRDERPEVYRRGLHRLPGGEPARGERRQVRSRSASADPARRAQPLQSTSR